MPVSEVKDEFPSEKDGSFEEAKEALARKDAEKQLEEQKQSETVEESSEEATNE